MRSSDGIRGFFVAYLTGDGPVPSCLPPILKSSISSLETDEQARDLINLSIMNVVMPSAMSATYYQRSLQDDDDGGPMEGSNISMSNTSKLTRDKGLTVLRHVLSLTETKTSFASAKEAVDSVIRVAEGNCGDGDVYWVSFFEKWGYGAAEKEAILHAMLKVKE